MRYRIEGLRVYIYGFPESLRGKSYVGDADLFIATNGIHFRSCNGCEWRNDKVVYLPGTSVGRSEFIVTPGLDQLQRLITALNEFSNSLEPTPVGMYYSTESGGVKHTRVTIHNFPEKFRGMTAKQGWEFNGSTGWRLCSSGDPEYDYEMRILWMPGDVRTKDSLPLEIPDHMWRGVRTTLDEFIASLGAPEVDRRGVMWSTVHNGYKCSITFTHVPEDIRGGQELGLYRGWHIYSYSGPEVRVEKKYIFLPGTTKEASNTVEVDIHYLTEIEAVLTAFNEARYKTIGIETAVNTVDAVNTGDTNMLSNTSVLDKAAVVKVWESVRKEVNKRAAEVNEAAAAKGAEILKAAMTGEQINIRSFQVVTTDAMVSYNKMVDTQLLEASLLTGDAITVGDAGDTRLRDADKSWDGVSKRVISICW